VAGRGRNASNSNGRRALLSACGPSSDYSTASPPAPSGEAGIRTTLELTILRCPWMAETMFIGPAIQPLWDYQRSLTVTRVSSSRNRDQLLRCRNYSNW
jgi:hypothetical protein